MNLGMTLAPRPGGAPSGLLAQNPLAMFHSPMDQIRRRQYKGMQGLMDRAPESQQWVPPMPPRFGTQGPISPGELQYYMPQLSDQELLTLFGVKSL